MVEKGLAYNDDQFWETTYESSVPQALRFMIDNEIVGMSWITLKAGTYQMRPKNLKRCNTQMEIDVWDYRALVCHSDCKGEYQRMAPIRILK